MTKAAEDEIRASEENFAIQCQLEEAVDLIVQSLNSVQSQAYTLVHDNPSVIEVLVGASFLFSLEPAAKHRLAPMINEEEEKRHGKEWRSCIRRKAGSTKTSAIFLDSLEAPGFLKRAKFKALGGLRWLPDPPAEEPDTWYSQLWSKGISLKLKLINVFLPFLKTTSFLIDYVKDTFFFNKRDVIRALFIKHLITVQGQT